MAAVKPQIRWTDEMKAFLAREYTAHPAWKVAQLFNARFGTAITTGAVQQQLHLLGVKKTAK